MHLSYRNTMLTSISKSYEFPVDTASKERRCKAYHTILLLCHSDLITDKLRYRFALSTDSHVLPIKHHYLQRIVQAASPQSMNVGAWCENFGQFPLHKVSNIRSHSCTTTNQHFCCSKEGKWQRKTKVSPWCMHCSCCGWRKGTSWAEATLIGEKTARSIGLKASGSQSVN